MNANEYLANTIYNLCRNSIESIQREEWDSLSNDINSYLREHNINEEMNCQEIFSIKPDEYDRLIDIINETFENYPLIQAFFDENRDLNFPQLDMIQIIRNWCQDFVDYNDENNDDIEGEGDGEDYEENEDDSDISLDELNDYITIKYFQGIFIGIYELFMNRDI